MFVAGVRAVLGGDWRCTMCSQWPTIGPLEHVQSHQRHNLLPRFGFKLLGGPSRKRDEVVVATVNPLYVEVAPPTLGQFRGRYRSGWKWKLRGGGSGSSAENFWESGKDLLID